MKKPQELVVRITVVPHPSLGTVVVPQNHKQVHTQDDNCIPVMQVFTVEQNGAEHLLLIDSGSPPTRQWFDKKGKLHRSETEGPAVEIPTLGYVAYYKHGKLHRTSGPALVENGVERFFINGVERV